MPQDCLGPLLCVSPQAQQELKACLNAQSVSAASAPTKDEKADMDRLASCVEQTLHLFLNLS